jgi:exopolysaccharide biosynthesis polyprenyl glycosylphosphotransferase
MPSSLTDARQRRRDATRGAGGMSARVAAALSRRRARGIRHEVALDAFMLVFASLAAGLSASASGQETGSIGATAAFIVVVLVAIGLSGVYRQRFVVHFLDDARSVLGATAIAAMSVTFVRVMFSDDPNIAAQQARIWLFAATYLIAGRAGYQLVETRAKRRGEVAEQTLIVGAGRVGRLIASRLRERPEFGLRPVAFFDDDPLDLELSADLPVFGSGTSNASNGAGFADGVEVAIRDLGVRHVIVTFSLASHDMQLSLVRRCQEMGVSVSLVPRLFEGVPDQTSLERLGGIPLISVYPRDPRGWQFAIKYGIDRVLALIGLVIVSPLLLFAAIGTLVTLGRPLLFRQDRMGIDGHRFDMLKFRTMAPPKDEAESGTALEGQLERGLAPGGVEGSDRRTRFGVFLRRSSLDELPQLINVLRGDMSLIGPRPERPEYVHRFGAEVHRYEDRLRVKSGITGWAQTHGLRGRTSIADRIEWDNYYIENWSPWLDLKIVLLTVLAVFRDRSE